MKLKTIDYLKETKQEFFLCRICGEIVNKDLILIVKNTLKNSIVLFQ